jgi:hypothetical protein
MIAIPDDYIQKWSLVEYRLRWVTNDKGDFLRWEEPQLIGDSRVFGRRNFMIIKNIKPYIKNNNIEGV